MVAVPPVKVFSEKVALVARSHDCLGGQPDQIRVLSHVVTSESTRAPPHFHFSSLESNRRLNTNACTFKPTGAELCSNYTDFTYTFLDYVTQFLYITIPKYP
jgi:hypothetical protein